MFVKILKPHPRAARSAWYYLHDKFEATVERVGWVETRNFDEVLMPALELGDKDSHHELAKAVSRHMNRTAQYAGRGPIENFVVPIPISLHPDDSLTKEQWVEVADRFIDHLGLSDHQALIVHHTDTKHDHIHLMVNRMSESGKLWDDGWSKRRSAYLAREIEREYGLRELRMKTPPHLALTAGEGAEAREQRVPLIEVAREVVPRAIETASSWAAFFDTLGKEGLWVAPGARSGAVVTNGLRRVKLSRVVRGRDALGGLEARFGGSFAGFQRENQDLARWAVEYDTEAHGLAPEDLSAAASKILDRLTSHQLTFAREDVEAAVQGHASPARLESAIFRDERLVPLSGGRFTTAEHLVLEDRFYALTELLQERSERRLSPASLRRVEKQFATLSAEQRSALESYAEASDLFVVQGLSGVGKTYVLDALRTGVEADGGRVVAVAPMHRSVSELSSGANLEAHTLASFFARGLAEDLDKRSVVVLDEASMVGLRDMAKLQQQVAAAEAQLVLVGDRGQLGPVSAGEPFRALPPDVQLRDIRRQEGWQREASLLFADGKIEAGLRQYADRGRIHGFEGKTPALEKLRDDYLASLGKRPSEMHLALVYTKADRAKVNELIRGSLLEAGELAPVEEFREIGLDVAMGDRVVFTVTEKDAEKVATVSPKRRPKSADRAEGVTKGDFGRVVGFDPEALTIDVRLDSDRRVIRFDPRELEAPSWKTGEASYGFEPAFAVHAHQIQGASVYRAFMLADPRLRREAFYVEATRQQKDLNLYVDRTAFDPPALKLLQEVDHHWTESRGEFAEGLGRAMARDIENHPELKVRAVVSDPEIQRKVHGEMRERLSAEAYRDGGFRVGDPVRTAGAEDERVSVGEVVAVGRARGEERTPMVKVRWDEGPRRGRAEEAPEEALDAREVHLAYALTEKQAAGLELDADKLHQQVTIKMSHSAAEHVRDEISDGLSVVGWADQADFPPEVRAEHQWESMVWHFERQVEDPMIRSLVTPEEFAERFSRTQAGRELGEAEAIGKAYLAERGETPIGDEVAAAKAVIERYGSAASALDAATVTLDQELHKAYGEPGAVRRQIDHALESHSADEVRQAIVQQPGQFGALHGDEGTRERLRAEQFVQTSLGSRVGMYDFAKREAEDLLPVAEKAREALPGLIEAEKEQRNGWWVEAATWKTVEVKRQAEQVLELYDRAGYKVDVFRSRYAQAMEELYADPAAARKAIGEALKTPSGSKAKKDPSRDVAASLKKNPERFGALRDPETVPQQTPAGARREAAASFRQFVGATHERRVLQPAYEKAQQDLAKVRRHKKFNIPIKNKAIKRGAELAIHGITRRVGLGSVVNRTPSAFLASKLLAKIPHPAAKLVAVAVTMAQKKAMQRAAEQKRGPELSR